VNPSICIFAYGGIHQATSMSWTSELAVKDRPKWYRWNAAEDAAIDRARGMVATRFLASVYDVLVMIDHDISWQPGDALYIARAAYERRAIVGGLVSKRDFARGWGGRFSKADNAAHEIGSDEIVDLGDDGYVGGAFIAIHRDVFDALSKTLPLVRTDFYPFFMPMLRENPETGEMEYLSEDWAFGTRAQAAGFKSYCAMKPQLIHFGEFPFTALGGNPAPPEADNA
jgi:hypothetical protein